jgi:hypothetical protein
MGLLGSFGDAFGARSHVLGEHHYLFVVPRHVYKPVAIESSTVNRDKCSSGNRMRYVASILIEQGDGGMLHPVSSAWQRLPLLKKNVLQYTHGFSCPKEVIDLKQYY